MIDALILDAAAAELCKLRPPKLWLTARVLARRIRARPGLKTLSQDVLYATLVRHAASRQRPRRIRNSPYPSARTLETLWGAIRDGGVREREVDPPFLQLAGTESEGRTPVPRPGVEDRDEIEEEPDAAPYWFLSYRFRDTNEVMEVLRALESSGHSVWVAGARIVHGQNINEEVIAAMRAAQGQLLYLSRDTFESLWVGKEILVGAELDLQQRIVIDGQDPELVELVCDWMERKDGMTTERIARYEGVSEQIAKSFRDLLRDYFRDEANTVYVHGRDEEARRTNSRLLPLSDFADPEPIDRGA